MTETRVMDDADASDDSISLVSTVGSSTKDFYEVECILAERKWKGVIQYLAAWKGYSETSHEWLPRENFNEDEIFNDWTDTKKRVANGLEKPFDVKAWEKRCKKIRVETERRKERRRAKRLRLSKHVESTSGPRKEDCGIQSEDSDCAPKRSDKPIKRRSVHQDPPPSSSTSASSSSSCSEDSDRPLVSRQESEIFTPNTRWTQAETIALEEGLRTLKGPRWQELLGLYGRNGKKNQVLKDKKPGDLYDKVKIICREFLDSGREPPEYLKPFSNQASSKGSRPSTPNVISESRKESRAASKQSSRSTSVDSLMAELQTEQRIQEANDQRCGRLQQNTSLKETLKPKRGREEESKTTKQVSADKPKPPQTSLKSIQQVGVANANETIKETPQAAPLNSHPKNPATQTKGIAAVEESSNNDSHQHAQAEDEPHANEPSHVSAVPQVEGQTKSQVPSVKEKAKPATNSAAQPESSHSNLPERSESLHEETARTTWSGTARAPTARPSVSNPPRRGAIQHGSSRKTSVKTKPKLGQIEPKKPSVTGDVTAGWNAEPKKRKSNNWATQNPDPVDSQPTKRSYKLSVQNRIFKSRRDGRPPDPSRLLFIDPKTGKAPTTVPAASATAVLSKTPLQLHQEELAARKAEERQAQKAEDAMIVNPSEPDPPPQIIGQNYGTKSDEQEVIGTGSSMANTSESVIVSTTGDMTGSPAHIDRPTPPDPASSRPVPHPNEPPRLRVETEKMATMSLQDCTKLSTPPAHPSNEAFTNMNSSYPSDNPLTFTLRSDPSQEQKNELFRQPEQHLVIGDIKLGENEPEGIKVKFVGFGPEMKKLLLTIRVLPRTMDFLFNSVCLASEYKAYFPAEPSDYLGSGSIVSYPQTTSAVESIVETLANNLQGALFFAQQYTMLMYPAGASGWAFLDNDLPSVHHGTSLRFAVRKPLPLVLPDAHRLTTTRLQANKPEQYTDITTKIQKHPIHDKDKNINIVFRDMFDIDFDRLVAQNGDQQHPPSKTFFLCFIPQGCESYEPDPAKRSALRIRTSQEHDLFVKFLQANGAKEIYSMQNIGSQEIESNGAWDYFYKKVKSGTIIFHDAFIRHDQVPSLAKHLWRGSVNVWKTSLSPLHPGEKHPHLVRLFPHGGVLLLTESLILYRPRESLRMLMWFRLVHLPAKVPGTWKIAVRPRVREWLLDIIDAYSDSGKDIFGCDIRLFADIYTEIYRLLQNPNPGYNGLMCEIWDYELPTDEAPIVSSSSLRVLQGRKEWKGEGTDTGPDDHNIKNNDDLLSQWFAEWAMVNLHNFRKFHIILGYTKGDGFTDGAISAYEKGWGHLEVMTFEEAFERHRVIPQTKLDEIEAKRRRKMKEELPAKKAATIKARREEREAARLALEARMQMFRDVGATDEEVMAAGRKLLMELGGSEKEVVECRVDMDRVFGDRWWEEDPSKKGEMDGDNMDTRGG